MPQKTQIDQAVFTLLHCQEDCSSESDIGEEMQPACGSGSSQSWFKENAW